MSDYAKLVEGLKRAATCVYLATEEAVADDLSKLMREAATALEALQAENERLDQALDEEMQERDRYSYALCDASQAMGGPEWCAKLPPEPPPESGDLSLDVPMLAAQIVAERDAWQQRVEALEGAVRWALGEADFRGRRSGEGAYWWRTELRKRAALT